MATTTAPGTRIDVPFKDGDTIDRNRSNQKSTHTDECLVCGRGITREQFDSSWVVHMTTDLTLYPVAEDVDPMSPEDQGWFPVGVSCAKSIPLAYRKRN